jgi:quercetin dioxygenase-like cupin family protein
VHHLVRGADIAFRPAYAERSEGLTRSALMDRAGGSVHMGVGMCALEPRGRVDAHVHSFEESFYVLDGTPVLILDGRAFPLEPGACGVVPVGVPHAWQGAGDRVARWIDMLAPQPRDDGSPADTFFLPPGRDRAPQGAELDIRDPRSRHLFRLGSADMALDELKRGAAVDAPTVSASMATALLAYSGIAVKMLVDQRLDAQLSTMFMVEYQPGGVAQLHDHPLEESYFILEGEVEAVADGERYTLEAGDFFWTGVGSIHGFFNTSGSTVRWLETQAPQPPARHSYRFNRDWDYLEEKLRV